MENVEIAVVGKEWNSVHQKACEIIKVMRDVKHKM